VVPVDRLDAVVTEWVDAIRLGKAAFHDQLALGEPAAYKKGTAVLVNNATRDDAREGIAAFLAKRRPKWTGS
jgi:enoyl-CoA hydratase/carnithine racemase